MILDSVNKWLKRFEKYLFSYKDGFFVFPYLYNSPELMIAYLSNMPMTKHKAEEQAIYSDSPFVKGVLRYHEIETGLWLMVSEMNFKVNMRTKAYNDTEIADNYFLAFSTYQNKVPISDMKINDVLLPSKSWAIYKPGAAIDAMHFKGTQGLYFNFVISKEWIKENLIPKNQVNSSSLFDIIDSGSGIEYWDDIVFDTEILAKKLWENLVEMNNFNHLQLKIQTLELIATFFKNIQQKDLRIKNKFCSSSEQIAMVLVEKCLIDNLTGEFPGIEGISKTVNMSSTKLKSTFKIVYGQPIFQYYRNKQMDLAMQLIKTSDIQIKNISTLLGYENPSKFTASFKKHHKILPSEVTKTWSS
jgi:AraC-like DNA-binding protein